jgi:hypothetical protein
VSGSGDYTVRIWDALTTTQRELRSSLPSP